MRWFWPSFFLFLIVVFVALGLWRPDLMERALHFLGWYLAAILVIVAVVLIVIAALFGWITWRKHRLTSLRQKDGAYPLQRVRLKNGAQLYFDPNHAVGAATLIHPVHGLIEIPPQAGWDIQLAVRMAVERTRQLEAMYPGDDVRINANGAKSAMPKFPSWKALESQPKANRPMLSAPNEPDIIDVEPEPARPMLTVHDGMNQSTDTQMVMGQSDDAVPIRWDMVASPHLRVHGKSQGAGKTNLIRTIAASALRMGHHVIVLDRRRFKDWAEFGGKAEMINTSDPARAVEVIDELTSIYRYRDGILGQHGAPNIGRLPKPPQRIVVIVSEFGALCEQAWSDGILKPMTSKLSMIMREAGATGVHVVIEDQFVDERWPKGISTNAEPVCGYLPPNYGAAGGYYHAHKLAAYTFHYGGVVFQSFDMRHAMPDVLRGVPDIRKTVVTARSSVQVEGVSTDVFPGVFSDVSPEVDPIHVTPGNTENAANKWDDFILAYMSTHVELWQTPPRGIRELARAMSRHETGSEDAEDSYAGTASKTVRRFRETANLPGGEKLGTDVTSIIRSDVVE